MEPWRVSTEVADGENCSLQEDEKLSTVVPDLVHKPGQ